MFLNKHHRLRDTATATILLAVFVIALVGGASSKKTEKFVGPIDAGTFKETTAKDSFVRVADEEEKAIYSNEVSENEPLKDQHPQDEKSVAFTPNTVSKKVIPDSDVDNEVSVDTNITTNVETLKKNDGVSEIGINSAVSSNFTHKPNEAISVKPDSVDQEADSVKHDTRPRDNELSPPPQLADKPAESNAIETSPPPVKQLTEEEIRERLDAYRSFVHKGRIYIELDLRSLKPSDIETLAAFYVFSTDVVRLQIDVGGTVKLLTQIPKGKLAADLLDSDQWPDDWRTTQRQWIGAGPADVNMTIILSDATELLLYRALFAGLGPEPKPDTKCLIQIRRGDDDELVFQMQKSRDTSSSKVAGD
ncbi:hypothetical protein Mal35_16900 [Gimesia maris]|uniref:hypothetical protein n=1 Tax=Gimesia maris TaxID=122 RepID=UPI00118A7F18|nr:hypothetical protein [Gimesia maris]QDT78258.1 hypothetical protein Mal35_16900 [Gimesia maris]